MTDWLRSQKITRSLLPLLHGTVQVPDGTLVFG